MVMDDMDINKLNDKLNSYKPKIVGINVNSISYAFSIRITQLIKKYHPETYTVLGGAHISATTDETLRLYDSVDYLIPFEAEKTFLELTKCLLKDKKPDIKGIIYKENNEIINMGQSPFEGSLDELPFPELDLIDDFMDRNDYAMGHRYANVITGRGCPYRCSFCGVKVILGKKPRFRSADNIIEEMIYLNKKYDLSVFSFADSSLFLNITLLNELCEQLKNKDLRWSCNARIEHITNNPDILRKMKTSGCTSIRIGIENINKEILALYKKDINKNDIINAIELINNSGLRSIGNFIIGSHLETDNTIEENLNFIRDNRMHKVHFSILAAYPGTDIFEEYTNKGFKDPLWYTKDGDMGFLDNRFSTREYLQNLFYRAGS